ncbi:helix-turn-helix transcriptional regulator [Enterococcus hirae]|uniref:helix-turn-helix transcriptional regulator n=1 Tax=Enterococcus hirae TaxID=1354 RepID=UPI001A959B21|nr:helix-turn-helix transcriptional regulator [Enterococcus hirae]MBO1102635.1 helix-turn-helix transcriptional regulator [Enterococcus hirae]
MAKQAFDYTNILKNFSTKMKAKRLELKMTQKELAKIVGVNLKTIQNYENMKTIPQPTIMENVALALKLPLEEMIENDSELSVKLKIANQLEDIEENPFLEGEVNKIYLTALIFDKIDFQKRLDEGDITEQILDDSLGGTLDISREEKILLIQAKLQKKIDDEIKRIEKRMNDNYHEFKETFRPLRIGFGAVDKEKY